MTEQARIIDKLAIIRSMHHTNGSHGTSSHLTQTGYYLRHNQNRENEMPSVGSITSKLRGANESGVPAFETVKSADDKAFSVANLTLLGGLTHERLNQELTKLTFQMRVALGDQKLHILNHFREPTLGLHLVDDLAEAMLW